MPLLDDLSSVSIVVLSYNRKDVLEPSLTDLLRMVDESGCELILVDNASTDGTAEFLRQALNARSCVTTFFNQENTGVAAGRNLGWRAASREFILNIDDDTIVSAEAVDHMLSVLRDNPAIGIVSPRILHARTGTGQLDHGDVQCGIGNFHGACHMVRRSLVDTMGYNDEACSFGGEELDFSIRTRVSGFDVVYTPLATVLHDSHVRQGQEGLERRSRWLYNFVRIHHKHFPFVAALTLSARYTASHVWSGVRAIGFTAVPTLLASAVDGLRAGRQQHQCVDAGVVEFYTNPELRPDLGNVPILHKLRNKFAR